MLGYKVNIKIYEDIIQSEGTQQITHVSLKGATKAMCNSTYGKVLLAMCKGRICGVTHGFLKTHMRYLMSTLSLYEDISFY